MATGLRERLPAALRDCWERLDCIDARLRDAIPTTNVAHLDALAASRSDCIRELCAGLDALDETELRTQALAALNADNARLLALGESALAAAANQSATSAHQRRAIAAYGAQDGEA